MFTLFFRLTRHSLNWLPHQSECCQNALITQPWSCKGAFQELVLDGTAFALTCSTHPPPHLTPSHIQGMERNRGYFAAGIRPRSPIQMARDLSSLRNIWRGASRLWEQITPLFDLFNWIILKLCREAKNKWSQLHRTWVFVVVWKIDVFELKSSLRSIKRAQILRSQEMSFLVFRGWS